MHFYKTFVKATENLLIKWKNSSVAVTDIDHGCRDLFDP